jgi:hypothetical protein
MTQLPGVPNSRDVIPGMAHFAGTGPTGTYCFQCSYFWNGSERSAGECREFMRLCPRKSTNPKKRPKVLRIPPRTPSCRYFKERRHVPES